MSKIKNLLCKSCKSSASKTYCSNCKKAISKLLNERRLAENERLRNKKEKVWLTAKAKRQRLLSKLDRMTIEQLAEMEIEE